MRIFKLLGATTILSTCLAANAQVGDYIKIENTSPLAAVNPQASESDHENDEKINREELVAKIESGEIVELTSKQKNELVKMEKEDEINKKKEQDSATTVLLISLGGIFLAGGGVGAGMWFEKRNNRNRKNKI